MPDITPENILQALEAVKDPDLGASIVAMGMIKDLKVEGTVVTFTCELTTPACPLKEQIEKDIRGTMARAFSEMTVLKLTMTGRVRNAMSAPPPAEGGEREILIPQVKNVVLIAAGKGGVGKSTCALNLALALKNLGARVGLLDADIYAPALPVLAGYRERPKLAGENTIAPVERFGIETMSMGYLVDPNQPMLWRGPVINSIIVQFLRDVKWSALDYLIVDCPPGAAEVQHALVQNCNCSGVVLVTTPHTQARVETARVKALYEQTGLPLLGILENRSHNSDSGEQLAATLKLAALGAIPDDDAITSGSDSGSPIVEAHSNSAAALAFKAAAEKLAARVSMQALSGINSAS